MLHPTNLPDCAPILECILDFQEHLLNYACTHRTVVPSELEQEFGSDLADWINLNRQLILDELKSFMRNLSQSEKEAVLTQFQHDRQFSNFRDDRGFQFQLVTNPNVHSPLTQIQKWLNGYYKQLGKSGYHPSLCGHSTKSFQIRDWWDGYYHENPKRFTCAVCDSSLNVGGPSIEHYLPKSRYPVLSLHPANLIPLCKVCNNDFKHEKDPLDGQTLPQVYLPYHHDIRSETKLEFSKKTDGSYQVILVPITHNPDVQDRINNLVRLFDIPMRWEKAINEVSETALSQLKFCLKVMREDGDVIDDEARHTAIDRTCACMEAEWGKLQYRYLATEWLRWSGQHEFCSIAKELAAEGL